MFECCMHVTLVNQVQGLELSAKKGGAWR